MSEQQKSRIDVEVEKGHTRVEAFNYLATEKSKPVGVAQKERKAWMDSHKKNQKRTEGVAIFNSFSGNKFYGELSPNDRYEDMLRALFQFAAKGDIGISGLGCLKIYAGIEAYIALGAERCPISIEPTTRLAFYNIEVMRR